MKEKKLKQKNLMSNIQSLKASKGITLIALVITIIVMLILVAVTISMAINGGLFNYAGKAVGETKNAINAEQELAEGKIEANGKIYNSIDEYIDEQNNNGVHDEEPDIEIIENFYKGNAGKLNIKIIAEEIDDLSGVECELYKVGTINGNEIEWEEALKKYVSNLTVNPSEEEVASTRTTLENAVILAGLEAETKTTSSDGVVTFERFRNK